MLYELEQYDVLTSKGYLDRLNAPTPWSTKMMPHHVGMITGRTAGGEWIVRSGNDGARVRERPRSVAGAVFRVG